MQKTLILFVCLALTSLSSTAQSLVISEIMYDSPGADLEFLEFYNNGTSPINLLDYEVADGINYVFGDISLAPAESIVITSDSVTFAQFYFPLVAFQWESGSLSNGGEEIAIVDNNQDTIIQFEYSDNLPWSQVADGGGSSLILCDPAGDFSEPSNWERSTTLSGEEEGVSVYADPGTYLGCSGEPFIIAEFNSRNFGESDAKVEIEVYLDNAPDGMHEYVVSVAASSTAELGTDFILLTDTLRFGPSTNSSEAIELEIIDDAIEEEIESVSFTLTPLDAALPAPPSDFTVTIVDNDGALRQKLAIRGVLESPVVKAIELSVVEDFEEGEILRYSLGSANNGNGSEGPELRLDRAASAGDCVFVTTDTTSFKAFFDLPGGFVLIQDEEEEVSYNGNDAIELFENGELIDVFGEAEVDGEGAAWDYNNGWAKRRSTGLNTSTTFDADDWDFSGVDGLDKDFNFQSSSPYNLECLLSSVIDTEVGTVTLYPNPTTGQVTISAQQVITSLSVIDTWGKVLMNTTPNDFISTIDISETSNGLYLISYQLAGETYISKLFKTN